MMDHTHPYHLKVWYTGHKNRPFFTTYFLLKVLFISQVLDSEKIAAYPLCIMLSIDNTTAFWNSSIPCSMLMNLIFPSIFTGLLTLLCLPQRKGALFSWHAQASSLSRLHYSFLFPRFKLHVLWLRELCCVSIRIFPVTFHLLREHQTRRNRYRPSGFPLWPASHSSSCQVLQLAGLLCLRSLSVEIERHQLQDMY